jgi:hypothetical protein
MEWIKGTAALAVLGATTPKVVGLVVKSKLVPVMMAMTGKVVAGVGTMHAAGGATAVAQTLAASLMTPGPAAAGALIAVCAYAVARRAADGEA